MCRRTRSHGRCSDGAEAVLTHSGQERLSREDFLKRTAAATEAAKSGNPIEGLPDGPGSGVTTGQMGYLFNKAAAKDPAQINKGTFSTAGTHDRITIVDRHTYKPGPLRRMRVGTSEETRTFSQVDRVNAEGLTELSVAETDRVFVEATNLSKDATLKISATQRSLVGLVVGATDSVAKNSDGSFSITRTHEDKLVTLTITGVTERVLLARGDAAAKQGLFKALSAACTSEEISPPTGEPEAIPAPEPDADTPNGRPTEDLTTARGDLTPAPLNNGRTTASRTATAPSGAGAPTAAPDPSSTAAAPVISPQPVVTPPIRAFVDPTGADIAARTPQPPASQIGSIPRTYFAGPANLSAAIRTITALKAPPEAARQLMDTAASLPETLAQNNLAQNVLAEAARSQAPTTTLVLQNLRALTRAILQNQTIPPYKLPPEVNNIATVLNNNRFILGGAPMFPTYFGVQSGNPNSPAWTAYFPQGGFFIRAEPINGTTADNKTNKWPEDPGKYRYFHVPNPNSHPIRALKLSRRPGDSVAYEFEWE